MGGLKALPKKEKIMNIKMLKTITASKDKNGTHIKEYIEGQEYEVFDELKQIFLQEGWAIELRDSNIELQEIETQELQEIETQDVKFKKQKDNKKTSKENKKTSE
jgi:hypothetical protein